MKRTRSTTGWARLRKRVLARDGFRCRMCGGVGRFEVDHIRPLHLGGGDGLDNLQTLCRSCHFKKTAAENTKVYTPGRDEWQVRVKGHAKS